MGQYNDILREKIRSQVFQILEDKGGEVSEIDDHVKLSAYGIDSLNIVSIMMFLSEELDVDLEDFDLNLESFLTIDHILLFAQKHLVIREA